MDSEDISDPEINILLQLPFLQSGLPLPVEESRSDQERLKRTHVIYKTYTHKRRLFFLCKFLAMGGVTRTQGVPVSVGNDRVS